MEQEKRDVKGRFVKGVSGNPGGRPKDFLSQALRAAWTDEDIKRLGAVVKALALSGNLEAVKMSLDRFEGKAPQSVDVKGDVTVRQRIMRIDVGGTEE